MELGIKGKCALITGASRGLGMAIATSLAEEGVKVAVVARDNDALSSVVKKVGGNKSGHFGISLDLMTEDAPKILKEKLIEKFGYPEIIVHNLGGTLSIKNALSSIEEYQNVWKFNLGIAVELNRLFIPYMQERKWGRIVHISSSSAVMVDASLPYSSAKAALNAYVKGLAREVAKTGIIVSAVMPGPFISEGGHWDFISKNFPEKFQKFVSERMPMKRLATPEEISGIVTFLCSEKASFCVGTIIPVDGGFI